MPWLGLADSLLRDPIPKSVRDASGRLRPPVPLGRRIELPGRGTMFVREVEGPPGAPTVVLLHGWMASGGLNWFRVFEALGREFRVLAPDLRGHARGQRSRQFRLADCADDVAAMCRVMRVDPVLVVGYSMGGPVAQLLWRRHRDLVAGLVLCATSDSFVFGPSEGRALRHALAALGSIAHVAERALDVPASALRTVVWPRRPADFLAWATAELGRHSVHMLAEAALSVGGYRASDWISRVDVPTGIVVTTRDLTVSPSMQFRLAESIPHATVHPVDGGHSVCVRERFVAPLVDACTTVASRAIG
ncbi:MAG: alpha/beta fold hydrolase [Acidimicrobiia bacterium]